MSEDDQPGADGPRIRLVEVGLKGMVKGLSVKIRKFKRCAGSWWAFALHIPPLHDPGCLGGG